MKLDVSCQEPRKMDKVEFDALVDRFRSVEVKSFGISCMPEPLHNALIALGHNPVSERIWAIEVTEIGGEPYCSIGITSYEYDYRYRDIKYKIPLNVLLESNPVTVKVWHLRKNLAKLICKQESCRKKIDELQAEIDKVKIDLDKIYLMQDTVVNE